MVRDDFGNTTLHIATYNGNTPAVKIQLECVESEEEYIEDATDPNIIRERQEAKKKREEHIREHVHEMREQEKKKINHCLT
mmetsp:Transcript_11298/g.17144  ORF Transcript_11298/g.17144 Transcript_11298/m.17144 type:complete len:81 (-) Transcript_11298:427-669(-)|eukprot:CAMPEP_0194115212 /NCGR_PEP_ID=MMETSP0150-20130528/22822_1 /TAXON_ID=122233 /ORGANISM="Chaetoceros debilis, Strain MM31A-1" /LENGTH=80 /DNA_ID=CAMNT_0038805645 /DNA_START=229 /DNA_END=471 /DNA_ORIENTATION=+